MLGCILRLSLLFFSSQKIINFQVNHRHSVKISQNHLINLVSFFENGVYEPYSITLFGFDVASKSRVSLRRTNWTTQNGRILFSAMLRSVEVWYRVFKKCCDSWSSSTMSKWHKIKLNNSVSLKCNAQPLTFFNHLANS